MTLLKINDQFFAIQRLFIEKIDKWLIVYRFVDISLQIRSMIVRLPFIDYFW